MAADFPTLPPALSGEREEIDTEAGRVSFYRSGPAAASADPPLFLIHSVNAAGSAYEMRPLYDHYAKLRPVYALDLPGFGFSDRSDREYTPHLMTLAVQRIAELIAQRHGGAIDAIALSLGGEFLARAANQNPDIFRTLGLISPTGFDGETPRYGLPGSTRGKAWLYGTFTFPLWRKGFFTLLTSRRGIRFFLEKTWGSKQIDEGLFEYDYLTTHQPGASNAPYYFVSGYLFSLDITRVYEQLRAPVWMVHGVRGDFQDYRYKAAFAGKPNWTIQVSQTGALPHFELPAEIIRDYDAFSRAQR